MQYLRCLKGIIDTSTPAVLLMFLQILPLHEILTTFVTPSLIPLVNLFNMSSKCLLGVVFLAAEVARMLILLRKVVQRVNVECLRSGKDLATVDAFVRFVVDGGWFIVIFGLFVILLLVIIDIFDSLSFKTESLTSSLCVAKSHFETAGKMILI
jgi:hypothetical protein